MTIVRWLFSQIQAGELIKKNDLTLKYDFLKDYK